MDWITWVIQGAVGIALSVIVYLWKQDRKAIDAKIEDHGERIKSLEKEMKSLPFIYTTREDFIRAINGIEQRLDRKLDSIIDRLTTKEGK